MSSSDSISVRSGGRNPIQRKLCEGLLEHKSMKSAGSQYDKLWLVLKGNILYIFTDTTDNQLGSLTIDNYTVFRPDGGDPVKGYKFDLRTRTKQNRFKSKKLSERELWRGYIMGVATGHVPDDLDLLEEQVKKIRADITAYHRGEFTGNRVSIISGGSNDSGVEGSMKSGFSGALTLPGSRGSNESSGSGGSGGGPTMVHKFYSDRQADQTPPSWFFSGCSREKAEEILTKHSNYGNTLMRESTSHMKSGSYVISKRVRDIHTQTYMFEHYEVMRVAGGYKLNVQNEHNPMRCLTDVIEYFKETSGGSTHLMDTNDPYRMGLSNDPEYQRQIKRTADPEPWSWPPPDYEDPLDTLEQDQRPRHPVGASQTVTPKSVMNARTSGTKKSVQFHPRNTFAAPSTSRPHQQTTMNDIIYRSNAAERLRDFDTMIDSFETGNIYQNDDPMNNPDLDNVQTNAIPRTMMPLPPTPHDVSSHSYVNEEISAIDSLPVAPAPPVPLQATANVQLPVKVVSTPPNVQLPVKVVSTPPKPAPKPASSRSSIGTLQSLKISPPSKVQHTKPSPGFNNDFQQNIADKRAQLRKTQSEASGLGSNINTKSPQNMPTWNTKPKSPGVSTGVNNSVVNTQRNNNRQASVEQNVTPGVDESDPGGVRNISKMFESSARVSQPRSGAVKVGHQGSVDRVDGTQETAKGVKGVNVSQNEDNFTPPSVESLSHRRKTDPGPLANKVQGLNASFIRRLEGVLSGPQSPGRPNEIDHEYDELPPIKPDAVTYAHDIDD